MLQRIISRLGQDTVKPGAETERTMGFGNTIMVWLAANMVVTTLLTGTLFIPDVPYSQVILIILLGTLLGVTVLALVGNMGTRTGLPTMIMTRASFGVRGANFPAFLNVAVLMGWSWIQALLAGVALNSIVETTTGFSNVPLFAVLVQTFVVLLALFGHQGIEKIEPWIASVMIVLAMFVFYRAFSTFGIGEFLSLPAKPSTGLTAGLALDVVVATAISWTVLSADFNRNAKTQRGGMLGTVIGYTTSTFIAMSLGTTATAYALLRTGNVPPGFNATVVLNNFGLPAALVILLSVLATNTLVVYGMTLSYLNFRPNSSFLKPAIILGIISIIGATWQGFIDRFLDFILLIGTFFVPIFAIMLADYYLRRRGEYSEEDIVKQRGGPYWYTGGFNVPTCIVYLIGAGLAFYWTQFTSSPFSIGTTVPVFALTFVLYLVIQYVAGRITKRRSAAKMDREMG